MYEIDGLRIYGDKENKKVKTVIMVGLVLENIFLGIEVILLLNQNCLQTL